MADSLTATLDTAGLFAALDHFGDKLTPALRDVAHTTAQRIAQDARARIHRRTGATAESVIVREDHEHVGYVVTTEDVRTLEQVNAKRLANAQMGRRGRKVALRENVPHVGHYLEYGTVHMAARPFFWASARLQAGPYDRAVRVAVQDAIDTEGLGS